jgi:hypothetical protein
MVTQKQMVIVREKQKVRHLVKLKVRLKGWQTDLQKHLGKQTKKDFD